MYQSIDDNELESVPVSRKWGRPSLWITLVAVTGLSGTWYLTTNSTRSLPTKPIVNTQDQAAEIRAYRTAITERSAALRRARLTDFSTTYPDSPRTLSVYALLDVLHEAEATRWEELTDEIFDPRTTKEDKLFALDSYEREWGASLLGGRDEEIAAIRAEMEGTTEKFPSRKLKIDESPISEDIEDDIMVGAFEDVPLPPPPPPPPPVEVLIVKGPEILRAPTPDYPRKARRRGVEAVVTLSLDIDAKGRVALTELISVDARRYQRDFVKAAEQAAQRTQFSPKMVGETAEPASGIIKRYRFQMDN